MGAVLVGALRRDPDGVLEGCIEGWHVGRSVVKKRDWELLGNYILSSPLCIAVGEPRLLVISPGNSRR